jgi:alpha-amylase
LKPVFLFLLLTLAFQTSYATQPANNSWIQNSVFYEIFVRSFQDSNGDGIGDLNGVTSRLDYLQSLGVRGLWLMPIYESPTYHGYDTVDYRKINPDYGTMADFKNLLQEAHRREIHVILDIALNHTSTLAPQFQTELTTAPKNEDAWYLWFQKTISPWVGLGKWYEVSPDRLYYSSFSKGMPDLNWYNPAVRQELSSILHYWSDIGVDGFRLDAARYYVKGPHGESDTIETHNYIRDFVQSLKKDFSSTMFVGEIWADSKVISTYVNSGDQLDLAFNFPVAFGLTASLKKETAADFLAGAKSVAYDVKTPDSLAPFVTNHDMIRIATEVGGDANKLKLAAMTILSLPGTPFVYYGEEIGLPNGPGIDDRQKRTPMQWDASSNFGFSSGKPWFSFADDNFKQSVAGESADGNSVLQTYKKWIHFRNSDRVLQSGDFKLLKASNANVASFVRTLGDVREVVVLNFSSQKISSTQIDLGEAVSSGTTMPSCPMNDPCEVILKADQTLVVGTIQPYSATIIRLTYR